MSASGLSPVRTKTKRAPPGLSFFVPAASAALRFLLLSVAATSTVGEPAPHPLRALLIPNAKRIFVTTVVWAVLMSVYSRLMEEQGLGLAHQYDLWTYLSGSLPGIAGIWAVSSALLLPSLLHDLPEVLRGRPMQACTLLLMATAA